MIEEKKVAEALESFNKKELYRCLQCAVCTGSCPVSRVVNDYNPREIILRYSLHGEKNVLEDELMWCCATCYACQERCPHEIDITGLLTRIMNQAAQKGNLPKTLSDGIKLIAETGRLVKATKKTELLRRDLGLEPLKPPNRAEILSLLRATGLDEIVEIP